MQKGKIGVTTENIFPVIKKFLYSDHEIFLRELVSNAVDATQKLRTLATFGDYKGEVGDEKVSVSIDREAGTLTVSDHGIGMDADDIEKYICQIAFSGAEEFLAKYKDTANTIIGHFGLGFFSAFMVARRVVIRSLSYKDGAKGVEWDCDGSPEYTLSEIEKAERGTDVILYIDDEDKQFLEQDRIEGLLKRYCRFLPVPVVFGKEQEWKDGKMADTDRDNIVNATEPLWTRKPSELKDEDYLKFYHELMPGMEDPMFWIHLNVDYPFTLTGILYFPKVHSGIDLQKNRIQLYCNQVYVTDQVEGVVPEFMTLMQGVIDSPDIPLNVSRSYLQADTQVKKISSYISKKVAERLQSLFNNDRKEFEKKWDDIRIFIDYGMLTDEKFCEAALKFYLLRDTDGQYFTIEEYRKLTESLQTDKSDTLIWLYAGDVQAQYSYIQAAKDKGYNVLLMNGQLDAHLIGLLEQKETKIRMVRVDSDSVDRLIVKTDKRESGLTPLQADVLSTIFRSQIPAMEKTEFLVEFEAQSPSGAPASVTQSEMMRRMKEMSAMQPGMSAFYSQMPDNYTLIVNTEQEAVKRITSSATTALEDGVAPLRTEIETLNSEIEAIRKPEAGKDKKELTDEEKASVEAKEARVADLRKQESDMVSKYAAEQPEVRQIIDLALLAAGMLKGENLDAFIKRSVNMLQ